MVGGIDAAAVVPFPAVLGTEYLNVVIGGAEFLADVLGGYETCRRGAGL